MKKLIAGLFACCLALTGCGQNTGSSTGSASPAARDELSGQIIVFAAASLQKTFTELGDSFSAEHPGVKVEFSFAGSSDLVAQLKAGAPADVFASANEKNMNKAADAELVSGEAVPFVTNNLVIATQPGNPKDILSLQDLANPDLKVVICAPQVPCGDATVKVSEKGGVKLTPASEENSVTSVLTKVTSGEADAGLVYSTDAKGAGNKVTAVTFPESAEVTNIYPIALLKSSQNAKTAQAFIDYVLGEKGQQVLGDAGFGKPKA